MTYSMIGRCAETGAFGGIVGTSSLAVGARCLQVGHGVGAVLSQHRTDPRLAEAGLRRLEAGDDAKTALAAVVESAPGREWRQIAVLDGNGGAAAFHGRMLYSIHSEAIGADCIAIGNILDNPDVTRAMADRFVALADAPLEARLMASLKAGREAGGEILEPLHSAALTVSGPDGVPRLDLRVDIAEEAVAALADLLAAYGDQADSLRQVALDPDAVPVSRAMFEASVDRIKALGLEDRFPTARRQDDWTLRG